MMRTVVGSSLALPRDTAVFDACIVGAGPAGLAAAIKLKQLRPETTVCVLEKAAEVGAHTVGGGLFDPRALYELIPNWEALDTPVKTKVKELEGMILTETGSIALPMSVLPQKLGQSGLHMVSQNLLVKWLAQHAQSLGVNIYPSVSVAELAYSAFGSVIGVSLKDVGVGRDGKLKDNYLRGVEVRAHQTLLAEGSRGFLTEQAIDKYKLREWGSIHKEKIALQTYGIGLKEVWRLPDASRSGKALHTFNWPLDADCFGWGFLHWLDNDLHFGLMMSLNYFNPYLDPQRELQRLKTHPDIRPFFDGAQCFQFGANSFPFGGFYSVPRLTFPGGMLLGCAAGFFNPARAQGVNNAIKSGILAAEALAEPLHQNKATYVSLDHFEDLVMKSWLQNDIQKDRNYRQFFNKSLWVGMTQSWISFNMAKGKRHWFSMEKSGTTDPDCDVTDEAGKHTEPQYLEPDGTLTFDKKTSARMSRAAHEKDQPVFLKVRKMEEERLTDLQNELKNIETRVCPVGVFDSTSISSCVHCRACDIKVPYLKWTPPEGGEGPYHEV